MELGLLGWVLGCAAAFAVGLAKGGLSMVGMLGVPLMALIMSPVQAAGILLPVYVISDIGGLIAFRRSFDRRVLVSLIPGMLSGIALGWATARLVDESRVGLVVGLIGLAFSLNAMLRPALAGAPRVLSASTSCRGLNTATRTTSRSWRMELACLRRLSRLPENTPYSLAAASWRARALPRWEWASSRSESRDEVK